MGNKYIFKNLLGLEDLVFPQSTYSFFRFLSAGRFVDDVIRQLCQYVNTTKNSSKKARMKKSLPKLYPHLQKCSDKHTSRKNSYEGRERMIPLLYKAAYSPFVTKRNIQ